MKIRPLIATLGLSCILGGALWLRAEETAKTDAENTDKWIQIQNNQKDLLKKVDEIQLNLNFIKARNMSGGRHQ